VGEAKKVSKGHLRLLRLSKLICRSATSTFVEKAKKGQQRPLKVEEELHNYYIPFSHSVFNKISKGRKCLSKVA
jgi:hypothetical protein